MKTTAIVRYKTVIKDAITHEIVKDNPWKKNLVLNQGLNALARSTYACTPASSFSRCHVGSGSNPNRYQGGAVTFTQAGTTITASGSFFTAAMAGGLFKYGTDTTGAEYYIVSYLTPTTVTVDTSATVAGATAGTVWMTQQTTLQTQSFTTNTYQTLTGDCGTTFSAPTVTFKRTFVFAVQASPYTVNEIGWSPGQATAIMGRAVLSSSDVIGPTQYYVVVMELDFVYQPFNPTAVGDVGTGLNTAGDCMVESFQVAQVSTAGAVVTTNGYLDGSLTNQLLILYLVTFTQNATIQTSFTAPARPASGSDYISIGGAGATWTYLAASVGKMRLTCTSTHTTTGQTSYGIAIQGVNPFASCADVKFTAGQVLPVGSFAPTVVFELTYGRVLDNA